MEKETLILTRGDDSCEMIKICFSIGKNEKPIDALKRSYPKSYRFINEDTIVGESDHPYANEVRIVNDDEAYGFFNSKGLPPKDGSTFIAGQCDCCGRIARFIVSKEQAERYDSRIIYGTAVLIQDMFPNIPMEWREMFRYPMQSTCPKCWKEMFGNDRSDPRSKRHLLQKAKKSYNELETGKVYSHTACNSPDGIQSTIYVYERGTNGANMKILRMRGSSTDGSHTITKDHLSRRHNILDVFDDEPPADDANVLTDGFEHLKRDNHPITIGSVLYSEHGSNGISFYKVITATPQTVTLQRVRTLRIPISDEICENLPGEPTDDGTFRRKIIYSELEPPSVNIDRQTIAHPWHGVPLRCPNDDRV